MAEREKERRGEGEVEDLRKREEGKTERERKG